MSDTKNSYNQDKNINTEKNIPECICNKDISHPLIDTKNEYSILGWIGVFTGISVRPKKVRYLCTRCETIIAETTDPKALDRYL